MPLERGQLYELCRLAVTRFGASRFYDHEVRAPRGRPQLYRDYRHFIERLAALKQIGAQTFREQIVVRPSAQAAT
jgi:hypothetical protein